MRKLRRSVPLEARDQIVQAYEQGVISNELARQFDVTPPTMVDFLKKQGVRIRSRAEINRMRAPIDDVELIRLSNEAVLSQQEIAVRFGVSLPTIERACRRLGLKSKRGKGSPLERNFFWRGGQRTDRLRYVMVKAPHHPHRTKDGYVREHRLVMERILGRYLLPEEEVHHKDGNPANNHPDNLLVFPNHAEHLRYEWQERWYLLYQRPPANPPETAHPESLPIPSG